MHPAIKPGTTPEGPLPVLGHTKNYQGVYSYYVTPEMIADRRWRQIQADQEWRLLEGKKNK